MVSTRFLHPLIALAGTAVLGLSLVGSALAQEEVSASPSPGTDAALETRSERPADLRAERQAARAERKAERDAAKTLRRAERREWKAERAAARRERAAGLGARKAAWAGVKEACAAELQAVRTETDLDRAGRRDASRQAKASCREQYLAARSEALAAAAPIDELYTEAAADGSGVVRTDLGIAAPGSAPGEELGLWHYLIPTGTALAPHTHPGWQLARVTDGELEYTVLEGEGVLLRADGSEEPMGPGTYLLEAGDGVIENPALVHLGANRTDEPVTLISATLFEAGQPISTTVEAPASAE